MVRDEVAVDQEVARRLVPSDELARFREAMVLLDIGVTALEVAEHFDVPPAVARAALLQLSPWTLSLIPSHERRGMALTETDPGAA